MQKLVWINGNDEEINLTSGDFGITNWEGFSNVDLNVQSQQVPFQDGSVFLDALLSERQLSVTLAIQDGNDLEKRYRLKRELIHRLNPKLGEGYLIYTNDFISKRIKCVPKLPLFPNKNSNDRGTQKASLSWTACDPYWEDVEETSVDFGVDTQPVIVNEGDVPAQVKIDFFTSGVTNPKITNINTNKSIKYNGILNEGLQINTEVGNKYFQTESLNFDDLFTIGADLWSVTYAEDLGLFVAVAWANNIILTSEDGKKWDLQVSGVEKVLYGVTYSENLKLFVTVGESGAVLKSQNGKDWTSINSGNNYTLNSIDYSESLGLFVSVGFNGKIVSSPDGETWTERTSGVDTNLNSVKFENNIFIAVGNNGVILTSSDGINWTSRTSGISSNLNSSAYSDILGLFVIVSGSGKILTSSDGINWTSIDGAVSNMSSITYSETLDLFVAVGDRGYIEISYDGINWSKVRDPDPRNTIIDCVIYCESLSLFVAVGNSGLILTSDNGVNWVQQSKGFSTAFKQIIYSEKLNLYIAVGANEGCIITSSDLITWSYRRFSPSYKYNSIAYSKTLDLFVAVGANNTNNSYIITSSDLITWTERTLPNSSNSLQYIIYCDELQMFIVAGAYHSIFTSADGINWTYISDFILSGAFLSIVYAKGILIVVGDFIVSSPDGETWTKRNLPSGIGILNSVTYNDKVDLFVAVGANGSVTISSDGINWIKRFFISEEIGFINNLFGIVYDEYSGLFIAAGYNQTILISADGINWSIYSENGTYDLFMLFYDEKTKKVIAGGESGIMFGSYFLLAENQIQNISSDSDMNFNLKVGDNQLRLNKSSGSFRARVTYRQKYLGV